MDKQSMVLEVVYILKLEKLVMFIYPGSVSRPLASLVQYKCLEVGKTFCDI